MAHIRPLPAKCPSDPPRAEYEVRVAWSGRVVHLVRTGSIQDGGGVRGTVGNWSRGSRRRFVRTVCAVPWDEYPGRLVFITLTYPGDKGRSAQVHDGKVAKAQLAAFRKRWKRRWGAVVGAWKMEFQARGQPHYHLAIKWDGGDLGELRSWIGEAWCEIVGGDHDHRLAGTQADWCKKDPLRYFAKNGLAAEKEHQNRVPSSYTNAGRYWGLWGCNAQWETVVVDEARFVRLRRIVKGLRRRKVKLRSQRGQPAGVWALTPDGIRVLEIAIRGEWWNVSKKPDNEEDSGEPRRSV